MHSAKTCLVTVILFFSIARLPAQSSSPFIINAAGGSYHPAGSYFQFEWSVGELAIIETYISANTIVTNGVLEPCAEPLLLSAGSGFEKNEIRLFPNATAGRFELNIAIPGSGRLHLSLINTIGQVIEKRNLQNTCCGHIEHFDITGAAAGVYLLKAVLYSNDNTGIIKQGTIKIVKVAN